MSDYGVPSDLSGVLPWEWAESRLLACRNYWVVTASADLKPHAMPVWGVWIPNPARFWFSCAASARKARNLSANPQITVAISDTVEVVVVEGIATLRRGGDDAVAAFEAYASKYAEPGKEEEMRDFVGAPGHQIWEVTPARAFAIIEREDEFAERASRWVW